MSDGSKRTEREQARSSMERLYAQRDTARTERDRLYEVVLELVAVHDGTRGATYAAEKAAAWQRAREALRQRN